MIVALDEVMIKTKKWKLQDDKLLDPPWTEKYRPQHFDDLVGNEDAVSALRIFAGAGLVSHLLIVGPPGTGKSSAIACTVQALLPPAFIARSVIELNASDERGIEVVRNDIERFVNKTVDLPPERHKMIVMDECEGLTDMAQQALRRIIDRDDSTRFLFVCNQMENIIESIVNRCIVLRFTPISDDCVIKRLRFIAEQEKIPFEENGLNAIAFAAEGDMRQAVNILQATYFVGGKIDADSVSLASDRPSPVRVRSALQYLLENKFESSHEAMQSIWKNGYSLVDVLNTLYKVIVYDRTLSLRGETRMQWIEEIQILSTRNLLGYDHFLPISGLLARMYSALE